MTTQIDRIRGLAHAGASLLRGGADVLDRAAGRSPGGHAGGEPPAGVPKDLDDVTVARKVESVVFRDERVSKGSIDVNAVAGVVYLRGEAPTPADVRRIVDAAREVPEVVRVENLLHLPGTPAPTRTDTPASQRKEAGRRTRPRSPEVHVEPAGITDERPVPGAEPSPAETARARRGRRAAPMGSKEERGGAGTRSTSPRGGTGSSPRGG